MCVLAKGDFTVWMDSAGHGEKRVHHSGLGSSCIPLLAQVLQSISVKFLQNELCPCAECGLHDAGVREFVMQNVEDELRGQRVTRVPKGIITECENAKCLRKIGEI